MCHPLSCPFPPPFWITFLCRGLFPCPGDSLSFGRCRPHLSGSNFPLPRLLPCNPPPPFLPSVWLWDSRIHCPLTIFPPFPLNWSPFSPRLPVLPIYISTLSSPLSCSLHPFPMLPPWNSSPVPCLGTRCLSSPSTGAPGGNSQHPGLVPSLLCSLTDAPCYKDRGRWTPGSIAPSPSTSSWLCVHGCILIQTGSPWRAGQALNHFCTPCDAQQRTWHAGDLGKYLLSK